MGKQSIKKGGLRAMENILSKFNGLDVKYLYAAVAIIVIAAVIALIKKAIKVGLVVLVIALAITYGGMVIKDFQQKYNIDVNGTVISMTMEGKDYTFDYKAVKQIDAQDLGTGNVKLDIETITGRMFITVPRFIFDSIKVQASKYDIKINER